MPGMRCRVVDPETGHDVPSGVDGELWFRGPNAFDGYFRDPAGTAAATHLAEAFVDDMDPQLREIGIGDLLVGKHIGRMMGMLGGRLGAYRDAVAAGDLAPALVRNLYRGEAPDVGALDHVAGELTALHERLVECPIDRLIAGDLP